jgi:hypothetical protein
MIKYSVLREVVPRVGITQESPSFRQDDNAVTRIVANGRRFYWVDDNPALPDAVSFRLVQNMMTDGNFASS